MPACVSDIGLTWYQAWSEWFAGTKLPEDCRVCTLGTWHCFRVLWWARFAKILAFVSGTSVLLDLVGIAWIEPTAVFVSRTGSKALARLRQNFRSYLSIAREDVRKRSTEALGCAAIIASFVLILLALAITIDVLIGRDFELAVLRVFVVPVIGFLGIVVAGVAPTLGQHVLFLVLNCAIQLVCFFPLLFASEVMSKPLFPSILRWLLYFLFMAGGIIDLLMS